MAWFDESAIIGSMTQGEFRDALTALGLTQADFGRILQHLSGQPVNRMTVNQWATGRRAAPLTVVVILRLWGLLPESERKKILAEAPPLASRPRASAVSPARSRTRAGSRAHAIRSA